MSKEFCFAVRVYFEDTDAGGVVYNASYVRFLERARTEYLRSFGISQQDLLASHIGFVVASLQMDFRKAARLDEELIVKCRIAEVKRSYVIFDQEITNSDGSIQYIKASVKIACVDLSAMRPMPFPENFKEVFKK